MSGKPAVTYASEDLVDQLASIARIKVWSLAVTVIGDLSTHGYSSDGVEGTALNRLFQRMGVKPEALRVALHRLRKEGWVDSVKSGRTSNYQLTDIGQAETTAVSDKVYLPDQGLSTDWQLANFETSPSTMIECAVKLSANCFIVKTAEKTLNDNQLSNALLCPISAAPLPGWVEARIFEHGHGELAKSLAAVLENVDTAMVGGGNSTDVLAIRMLSLHHWRRIALRPPAWLHMQQFEDGVIRQCHDLVHGVLSDLKAY